MERKMTETEYVKEKVIDIHELELQKSPQDIERISRVVFKTNEGFITYRPFLYVNELREINGFKVSQRKKESMAIGELPRKLWQLNEKLQAGMCRAKLSYFLWSKKVDNHVMPIRFMKEKQVNEMEFLDIEEKVK